MNKEEKRAICPNCESVNWSTENVVNTTDGKGIIQAKCNDCRQPFELEIASSSRGWTDTTWSGDD